MIALAVVATVAFFWVLMFAITLLADDTSDFALSAGVATVVTAILAVGLGGLFGVIWLWTEATL